MNIGQAVKIMFSGGSVESLTSNTCYNFKMVDNEIILCAEGKEVDFWYLTKEEQQGDFREVYIVETHEQLNSLSDKDREKLISETLEGAYNKLKFDESVRGAAYE